MGRRDTVNLDYAEEQAFDQIPPVEKAAAATCISRLFPGEPPSEDRLPGVQRLILGTAAVVENLKAAELLAHHTAPVSVSRIAWLADVLIQNRMRDALIPPEALGDTLCSTACLPVRR